MSSAFKARIRRPHTHSISFQPEEKYLSISFVDFNEQYEFVIHTLLQFRLWKSIKSKINENCEQQDPNKLLKAIHRSIELISDSQISLSKLPGLLPFTQYTIGACLFVMFNKIDKLKTAISAYKMFYVSKNTKWFNHSPTSSNIAITYPLARLSIFRKPASCYTNDKRVKTDCKLTDIFTHHSAHAGYQN